MKREERGVFESWVGGSFMREPPGERGRLEPQAHLGLGRMGPSGAGSQLLTSYLVPWAWPE